MSLANLTRGSWLTAHGSSFVIGTSASLFSTQQSLGARLSLRLLAPGLTCFADSIQNADIDGDVSSALTTLGDDLADIDNRNYSIPLVANWPNSFKGHNPSSSTTFESAGNDILQLTVRPPPFRSWFH